MARRSDHTRDELKAMILKTSWDIVSNDGFEGLSARNIAQKIGYAPGTIYNLYKSMDDLYIDINSQTLDRLYEVLASPECRSGSLTPIQNIKKMADLYRDFAKTYRPHWLMLFTHSWPQGTQPPAWYQEKIEGLFEALEHLLEPFYTAQQSRKHKMAARVLWASVHGLCFLEETGKISLISNQESPPDMTGYLIDNFISGIEQSPKTPD